MRRFTAVLIAFALAAIALPAYTQSLTGTVEGVIKDEQGGVLPGVTVTLTGKRGSVTATTGASGDYRFGGVDPGIYSVTAGLSGFRSKRADNIPVMIGKVATVNLTLGVGAVSESLDVVAEAPVVDVTSSATDNALSQDFLFNLPIRPGNAATSMLNYLPGINSGSAFGGNQDYGNGLMIDGVDTRDPEGGSAWVFFNYNIMEEVQVSGLGAPAEYGAFTGAVVNTVTKSGGNKMTGLFDVYYTKSSLQSDNIDCAPDASGKCTNTSSPAYKNAALKQPAQDRLRLDVTGQLGGPLIKDKLWFYASAQRYKVDQNPSGPVTTRTEVSPRLNTKLTWQPGPNDNVMGTFQYDNYNQTGRAGWGTFLSTDALTNRQDSPEFIWGVQWRHLFSTKTFAEVKYNGWWGYYDLNPTVQDKPVHLDVGTGEPSDSQGWFYYADRTRNQVNASLSHYADAFGKHDLKFGVEIERSKVRNRYGFLFNIYYADYIGVAPKGQYLAYDYGYDIEGRNGRESFYLQDAWHVSNKLTINPGVRLDMVRGRSPAADKTVYDTKNWAPRIGFAFDVTGDQKTVLKAHYGQYYEGIFFDAYQRAIPGTTDYVIYAYDPAGSKRGPLGNRFTEIDRINSSLYTIDPAMKHPRVDEFTGGFERALGKDLRLSVTGMYRKDVNAQSSFYPDARWTPTTVTNPLGGTMPGYTWANRSASSGNHLIRNIEGFQYLSPTGQVLGTASGERTYKGLMVVLDKRFTRRWQGRVSYVYSQSKGFINNSGTNTTGSSVIFDSASLALVNRYGYTLNDRPHELKIFATYQVPKIEVGLNAYWRTLSGRTYTPYQRYSSSVINYPSGSGREMNLTASGDRRLETNNLLDLRIEKIFNITGGRIAIYADILNAFNANPITGVITRYPNQSIAGIGSVAFESPASVVTPRQVIFGGRWSF